MSKTLTDEEISKIGTSNFKTLGTVAKYLGYYVGFWLVLILLTITAGIGAIVGLIIYRLGWKFTKIGYLIFDSFDAFLKKQISISEFKPKLRKSLSVTIILTVFFLSFLIIGISVLVNEEDLSNGLLLSGVALSTVLALIPQWLLLTKIKEYLKTINL